VTTATLSRSASVASIHLAGINAGRKKSGFPPLAASELALEFADLDRLPVRTKGVVPGARSNQAADAMWGGIVGKLNASLSSSRTPIAAVRTSPASSAAVGRVDAAVDWSSIASALNREAGLAMPARRAR
jgi:hypothetical protein